MKNANVTTSQEVKSGRMHGRIKSPHRPFGDRRRPKPKKSDFYRRANEHFSGPGPSGPSQPHVKRRKPSLEPTFLCPRNQQYGTRSRMYASRNLRMLCHPSTTLGIAASQALVAALQLRPALLQLSVFTVRESSIPPRNNMIWPRANCTTRHCNPEHLGQHDPLELSGWIRTWHAKFDGIANDSVTSIACNPKLTIWDDV